MWGTDFWGADADGADYWGPGGIAPVNLPIIAVAADLAIELGNPDDATAIDFSQALFIQ